MKQLHRNIQRKLAKRMRDTIVFFSRKWLVDEWSDLAPADRQYLIKRSMKFANLSDNRLLIAHLHNEAVKVRLMKRHADIRVPIARTTWRLMAYGSVT